MCSRRGADGAAIGLPDTVCAHTPIDTVILVCGESDRLARAEPIARTVAAERDISFVRRPDDSAVGGGIEAAVALAAPADIVLVSSDVSVAAGWLQSLRDAAYADSWIATAGAIAIDHLPGAVLDEEGYPRAAAEVRRRSPRVRPRVLTLHRGCRYIRRSALELVGPLDDGFWLRCAARGLGHVVADDVLIWYERAERAVGDIRPSAPLARALATARRGLRGLSVLIDARCLTGTMNGTQRHVLELIGALGRSDGVRVSALVPDELSAPGRVALEGIELRSLPEAGRSTSTSFIVRFRSPRLPTSRCSVA